MDEYEEFIKLQTRIRKKQRKLDRLVDRLGEHALYLGYQDSLSDLTMDELLRIDY